MNQTEAIKKAEDRLNLCIHISECSENKGRDKRRSTMSEIERAIDDFNNYVEMGYGQYFRPSSESTELALTALKEKLEREKNPLTWNERINQMTAEEKAPYFVYEDTLIDWEDDYNGESTSTETPIYRSSLASDMFFYVEQDAINATVELLDSPYTEGVTK